MRHIILLVLVLGLTGCLSSGAGNSDAATTQPTTPTTPVTSATQLVYTAKSTALVNAAGNTYLTITGDFDSTNSDGKFDDGRWVNTLNVTSASGKVCTVSTFTPHLIGCTFDARFVGNNPANGLEEITEALQVERILNDGTVQSVGAGNIGFMKVAILAFSRTGGFDIPAGVNAGIAAGYYQWNASSVLEPVTPYVTGFTVTNTGDGDATFLLTESMTSGLFIYLDSSTCGAYDGTYYHGTLAPGASCTFTYKLNFSPYVVASVTHYSFQLSTANGTFPVGTVRGTNAVNVLYDNNLGTPQNVRQDINEVFSN